MLGTPKEELEKLEKIKTQTQELRNRMEFDSDHVNGKEFKINPKEGEFESVTSNRALREFWKICNILENSKRKINIAVSDDKEQGREDIQTTEALVNGMLYGAEKDSQLLVPPADKDVFIHTVDLYPRMVAFKVGLGVSIYRAMIVEDEDGNPKLDLEIWHPLNTYWLTGKGGQLQWVCVNSPISEDEAKADYSSHKGEPDSKTGLIDKYNIFSLSDKGKQAQEGVIIGDEWVKKEDIGLSYLPIRITVGESYLVNNRHLIDTESRLKSYRLTEAGEEAKPMRGFKYDSSKGGKGFTETEAIAAKKNRWLNIDIGKGEDTTEIPPARTSHVELASGETANDLDTGGLGEIAYGRQSTANTAFGMDILNRNTREHLNHFNRGLCQDFIWLASEICSQFKNGQFNEVETVGFNSKQERFKKKIDPDRVLTDREFTCDLVYDEIRDMANNSQIAINLVTNGFMEPRDALDVLKLTDNPDRILANLERWKAREAFGVSMVDGLFELIEDFTKKPTLQKQLRLNVAWANLQKIMMASTQMPGQETGATAENPITLSNKQTAANSEKRVNVPPQVREAVINAGG